MDLIYLKLPYIRTSWVVSQRTGSAVWRPLRPPSHISDPVYCDKNKECLLNKAFQVITGGGDHKPTVPLNMVPGDPL